MKLWISIWAIIGFLISAIGATLGIQLGIIYAGYQIEDDAVSSAVMAVGGLLAAYGLYALLNTTIVFVKGVSNSGRETK